MNRNIVLLLTILVLAGGYTLWEDRGQAPAQKPAQPQTQELRKQAPDFYFETLAGKENNLSDFKGKPVILNFWATWCAPCVIEFPKMLTLAKKSPDAAFIFLSLDDNKDAVNRFLKKFGNKTNLKNIYIGYDDGTISRNLYGTQKLPETYLIDSNQMIAEKIIGDSVDWIGRGMQQKITDLSSPQR